MAGPEFTARIASSAVRAYDIRGHAGDEITARGAHTLGLCFAREARAEGATTVGVARDGRLSSPALEAALVNGLSHGGLDVMRLGLGPTPMLAFAIERFGLDGGVMVTASHNPPDDNGFKLRIGDRRIYGGDLHQLVGLAPRPEPGGRVTSVDTRPAYISRLAAELYGTPGLKVAWDCGNGATGAVLPQLVRRLPGEHVLLHAQVDGRFPGHHPDPALAENLADLQRVVVSERCDLGVAFDGDGDRIGVIDSSGAIVWPDQLLLFLAEHALQMEPGAAVAADVKSSQVLFDGVAACGGRPVMTKSGYVHVRAAAIAARAPLGGELSGHIFHAEAWDMSDDALFTAMRVLAAAGPRGAKLSAFRRALPLHVSTPELRIPCSEAVTESAVREAAAYARSTDADVTLLDGVRVRQGDGWWLLRASGTESKLTARCEARSVTGLATQRAALGAALARSGIRLPD